MIPHFIVKFPSTLKQVGRLLGLEDLPTANFVLKTWNGDFSVSLFQCWNKFPTMPGKKKLLGKTDVCFIFSYCYIFTDSNIMSKSHAKDTIWPLVLKFTLKTNVFWFILKFFLVNLSLLNPCESFIYTAASTLLNGNEFASVLCNFCKCTFCNSSLPVRLKCFLITKKKLTQIWTISHLTPVRYRL